jgi:mono/diheme cytochrome c family protein
MVGNKLSESRQRVGYGLTAVITCAVAWAVTPGIPVIWAPRANAEVKAAGRVLFEHEWQPYDPIAKGDGLGPVFNGQSCVACHFQGGVGGGGNNKHNVKSFEALPTLTHPEFQNGLIHAFAVDNKYLADHNKLRKMFPIIPNAVTVQGNCQVFTRDFDPLRTESINSTALFGAGWVDRLSGKTIFQHGFRKQVVAAGRELNGEFDGVLPGRPRVLADGRVGKFGWKAQFASLEDFVAAACANEIGLGNPRMDQAKPIGAEYPAVPADLDRAQFRELVGFVDTLPRPIEVEPASRSEAELVARGRAEFARIGCASCHTPDLGGITGVYSDFLLHRLDDRSKGEGSGYSTVSTPEVPLPEAFPLPAEWKTPALWGVADSAPYFHDGGSPTLEHAIYRHHGDAETVLKAYELNADRAAILAFLQTLRAPSDAVPTSKVDNRSLASAR